MNPFLFFGSLIGTFFKLIGIAIIVLLSTVFYHTFLTDDLSIAPPQAKTTVIKKNTQSGLIIPRYDPRQY